MADNSPQTDQQVAQDLKQAGADEHLRALLNEFDGMVRVYGNYMSVSGLRYRKQLSADLRKFMDDHHLH